MGDLGALIRAERLALIDLLETISGDEWSAPSLCDGWTVQGPVEAGVGMARNGFRLNRFIADSAVRWARRGTDAILEQLRVNAERGAKPMGVPEVAALADAVVHMLDIRRPLSRPRAIPP